MRVEYAKIFALAFMLFATQAMWTVYNKYIPAYFAALGLGAAMAGSARGDGLTRVSPGYSLAGEDGVVDVDAHDHAGRLIETVRNRLRPLGRRGV